jgi:hypothetical protein
VVHYAGYGRSWHAAPVEEVTLSGFAVGHPIHVVEHADGQYSPAQIVERARSRVGEQNYHLLNNNCEHFCNWCVSGLSQSAQTECPLAIPLWALSRIAGSVSRFTKAFMFSLAKRSCITAAA